MVLAAGNDCETFWDKDQLTDSCYQFNFQSTLSWREAWASCEQQGADLLSITEIHEQTYINGGAPCTPAPSPPIGGPGARVIPLAVAFLACRAPHGLQFHTLDGPERSGHQRGLAVVG